MELQQVFSDKANLEDQADLIGPGLYINACEIEIHFEKQIDFLVNSAEIGLIVADCWLPHFIGISKDAVNKEPLW